MAHLQEEGARFAPKHPAPTRVRMIRSQIDDSIDMPYFACVSSVCIHFLYPSGCCPGGEASTERIQGAGPVSRWERPVRGSLHASEQFQLRDSIREVHDGTVQFVR